MCIGRRQKCGGRDEVYNIIFIEPGDGRERIYIYIYIHDAYYYILHRQCPPEDYYITMRLCARYLLPYSHLYTRVPCRVLNHNIIYDI